MSLTKGEVVELICELKDYVIGLDEINKEPLGTRLRVANRMSEIKRLLEEFRNEHPNE